MRDNFGSRCGIRVLTPILRLSFFTFLALTQFATGSTYLQLGLEVIYNTRVCFLRVDLSLFRYLLLGSRGNKAFSASYRALFGALGRSWESGTLLVP